jgi:phosphate transport system substrate-binding protein
MSSRELKEEETAILNVSQIANDAIAIIVNPKNPLDSLSRDEIRRIFTGQITSWSEVHG